MGKPIVLLALGALVGLSLWHTMPSKNAQRSPESLVVADSPVETDLNAYPSAPYHQTDYADAGARALEMGYHLEAISLLQQAVAHEPHNVEAWVDLGEAYLSIGNCNCAIVKLTYALQLDPHHAYAYTLRARAYEMKGAINAAVADIHASLTLEPEQVDLWRELAYLEVERGDIEAALDAHQTALAYAPLSADLWEERADLYAMLGDWSAAEASLAQAERIEEWRALEDPSFSTYLDAPHDTPIGPQPADSGAIYTWGQSEYLQGLDTQIDKQTGNPDLYFERGRFFLSELTTVRFEPKTKADVDELLELALTDLNIAIALDPARPEYYLIRSEIHERLRNWTQALSDLDVLETQHPRTVETALQRARILKGLGGSSHLQAAQAFATYAEEHAADQNQRTEAYLVQGQLQMALGQWERSIMSFNQAMTYQPYRAEAYYYRGVAYLHINRSDIASRDIENALTLWQSSGHGEPRLIEIAADLMNSLQNR